MIESAAPIPPAPTPMASGVSSAVAPPPPPAGPRPVDATVRRRAWSEPAVRFWWQVTLALVLIIAYLAASQAWHWWRARQLVAGGRIVQATVKETGGSGIAGRRAAPDSEVVLAARLDGAQETTLNGFWDGGDAIVVGSQVMVHVDPADPTRWTAMQQAPSLTQHMAGSLVLLPIMLASAGVCLCRRAAVLRLWRHGHPLLAVVLDAQQTAIAPRSWAVRCTSSLPGDRRVLHVYVPQRTSDARPGRGDLLWLLVPSGPAGDSGSRQAVAAMSLSGQGHA